MVVAAIHESCGIAVQPTRPDCSGTSVFSGQKGAMIRVLEVDAETATRIILESHEESAIGTL